MDQHHPVEETKILVQLLDVIKAIVVVGRFVEQYHVVLQKHAPMTDVEEMLVFAVNIAQMGNILVIHRNFI